MAPGVTLRPYQEDAIRTAFEWIRAGRKRFILQSPTGCHRAGQGIRMHDGSVVPVEMVAVGDRVLGMYGQPRIVLKVHRGRQQMVRIVPEVGAPFVVNKYHILTLLNGNTLVDFLVRDWLQLSPSAQRLFDLFRVPAAMAHAASISPSQFERTKFHAEPLDIESFYGFELDGDGRYLLDDYTVTHNSGKTVLAARLILAARKQGAKSLFVAHRQELLTQAKNKLIDAGVSREEMNLITPGVVANMNLLIHVGSIQSFANRILPSELKLILIDEAHRSAAKSYAKLFELPNVTIIGLTATPCRTDNKPLDMYDDILVVAQPQTMIDQGFIVEPRTFTVPDEELPDLTGVHVKNGDYDADELDDAVAKRHLVGSIVAHWKYRAEGMRTIVSANSIKHSHMIVEEFLAEGIPAEHVDGDSPEAHRAGVIERLRSGETLVVSQVGLWIEGVDIPEAKCGIIARPTKSLTVHLQFIGRVVRPYGGITPVILDHAGNTVDLGLMNQERVYDLFTRRSTREMEEAVRGWRCDVCLFVNPPSAPACTVCGAEKPKKPKKILRTVDGTLVEVGNTPETRKEYWEQLWRRAYTNGELATWVVERYKKRFNEPPPDNWGPTPRPKKEFVWKHAANDAYLWQQVAAKQGMPQDWVRKKLKMKYDVECDPSMAPLEYINTLDEPGMAKRRERIAEQYTKRGMPVPEPVQYGASTIIPNKELHAALSLFKAAPEGTPVASAPATPGPVPNFGLPATAITPQRVAPSPPRAAKPSTIMTSSLSDEDADKQFEEEGVF